MTSPVQSALLCTCLAAPLLATAQSSVTLSGTLDVGVFRGFNKITQVGGISRSNFAISGEEDLGGGMQTTFKLSSRFHVDTGETEGGKGFFNAESTVGLKGGLGHLRLGRALTALWQTDWGFDPWYNYDSIASPAYSLWHSNSPADPSSGSTGVNFSRLNNGIFYQTPVLSGFTGHLSYGTEKQAADKKRSISGALRYEAGPLGLLAARERTPEDKKVTFLAAKYGMGVWQVMAAYDREDLLLGVKNRSYTLSGQYATGPMIYKLGYGRQQDFHANFFGASAIYAFSKRTNVYVSAGYREKGFRGNAHSSSAIGLGVNHSF